MPILDLNTMKVESKWHELKRKAKEKAKNGLHWVKENPELAAVGGTVLTGIVGFVTKVTKGAIRNHNLSKEQQLKDRYVYDRSLGMYLRLRRKLTNKDWATINNRRRNGERLPDILQKMNVLE